MTLCTVSELINQAALGAMTARVSELEDVVLVDVHMPIHMNTWMRANIAPRALYLFCESYNDGAVLYVVDGKFVLFTPRY